jgi:tryptophanyl-tRNA synthetase
MPRQISGFKPTGSPHLGNYLGAIRPALTAQHDAECLVFVADLHALTVEHDPARVRERTMEVACLLLAAGLDPARSILFVQSRVPEHTELHYLLECATSYGEVHRMIQFKEKAAAQSQVRLSLLTYPVLMAADVLLYGVDEVPVGEDQRQHIELARDVASRFNTRYGETFVIPKACHPRTAARVMDLSDPTEKMGKTNPSGSGVLNLLDPPEVLRRKVMRAVTDADGEVRYDPATKPGVANLLETLAACVDDSPTTLAHLFTGYRGLKSAVADTVVSVLGPVQARYRDFTADPAGVRAILDDGAARARAIAGPMVARAREAVGLGV